MHPIPESPTNVQSTNPYVGVDRGLMILNGRYSGFARVHKARWICNGPPGGISRIEFQMMRYSAMPQTAAEYGAGTLLKAPDGTDWFECISKGDCSKSIMVEYYARNVFQTYYCVDSAPEMITPEQKVAIKAQALEFTKTIGRSHNIQDMEMTIAFNASSTAPLTQSSLILEFKYGDVESPTEVTLTTMTESDPVREVIQYIKTH